MAPVLYSIGPFNVYAFGFFLSISFLLSTFIIWKYSREELKEEEYLDAYLYASIASLLSARLTYIALHFTQFGTNFLKYILVRETPGLSLFGGILGGIIYLVWYARRKKFDLLAVLDLFSLAVCLGLFFAKIGEQLGGAGYGIETSSFIGVRIIGQAGRHHPTEAYEALFYLFLFFILNVLYKRVIRSKTAKGLVFYLFILGSTLLFFLIEFLKSRTVYLYGLSFRQLAALVVILLLVKPIFTRVRQAERFGKKLPVTNIN